MFEVSIYTDGCCKGNPGPGAWAAILISGGREKEISGGDLITTNNQMELTAVLEGLCALKQPCKVTIFTDSQCVIGWLAGGWKRKNVNIARICASIDLLVAGAQHQVEYRWVKSHNGDTYNTRCDTLANAAVPA